MRHELSLLAVDAHAICMHAFGKQQASVNLTKASPNVALRTWMSWPMSLVNLKVFLQYFVESATGALWAL